MIEGLEFTNNWFDITAAPNWNALLKRYNPKKILEIGSWEGRSACSLIAMLEDPLEIHCIDTWEGGQEHRGINMSEVEDLFHQNTKKAALNRNIRLNIHKGSSESVLPRMIINETGKEYFDFIYIDGSHMACDVLSDAVLSWKLLKSGGVMAFDDYSWREKLEGENPLNCPKSAIDAFVNIYWDKLETILSTIAQCWIRKL